MRLAIFLVALLLQTPRASIEGAVVYLSSGEPATGAEVELTGVEGGRVISRTVKVSASGTFSGWLGVFLDTTGTNKFDWREIAAILEDAFRTVAPKSLVAELAHR